jgi:hypothetical protein
MRPATKAKLSAKLKAYWAAKKKPVKDPPVDNCFPHRYMGKREQLAAGVKLLD